jgi:4'-phosphopantetheinyl transferase EntD
MIPSLFADDVHISDVRGDLPEAGLYPEEQEHVRRAVPKRREEFVAGRACARAALVSLGFEAQPIPVGPRGAPIWPPGVVGSITHCEGYRAGAVALRRLYLGVGIDAEPNRKLPGGLLGDIALPAEVSWINEAALLDGSVHWDRLLFCIKEAVYKVWFPITGTSLGFDEAMVILDRPDGTFAAQLSKRAPSIDGTPLDRVCGSWREAGGLLFAGAAVGVRSESKFHRVGYNDGSTTSRKAIR